MILHRVSASAAVRVLPLPYARIYRVRADVLLKVLGGFAEERVVHSSGKRQRFTPADLELARRYYENFSDVADGRLQKGKLAELAKKLDRDPKSLCVTLCYWRRKGLLPPLGSTKPAPATPRRWALPKKSPETPIARPAWFANDFDKSRLMARR